MHRGYHTGLFSSLSYFFSGNGVHATEYELALQSVMKKDEGKGDMIFIH